MKKELSSVDCLFVSPSLTEEAESQLVLAEIKAEHRASNGQYFTPRSTAAFLSGMLDTNGDDLRLLDPGAGVGALSAAFVDEVVNRTKKPPSVHLTVWEKETALIESLQTVLEQCVQAGDSSGVAITFS